MVTQLLDTLARHERGLNLTQLSRALHAEPSAVQGALQWLVNKGRVVEIGQDNGVCTTCGAQTQCQLLAARGVRYALAGQGRKCSAKNEVMRL